MYTTGWGGECHGRGNREGGPDAQERQGTIVEEGKEGGGRSIGNSLKWTMHMSVGTQRVGHLWHRLGGGERSDLLMWGRLGASGADYRWPGTSCMG